MYRGFCAVLYMRDRTSEWAARRLFCVLEVRDKKGHHVVSFVFPDYAGASFWCWFNDVVITHIKGKVKVIP